MNVTEPVGEPVPPVTLTDSVTDAPGTAVDGAVSVTVGEAGETIKTCAADALEAKFASPG